MKQYPLGDKMRAANNFPESVYARACPKCGAPPWHQCVAATGKPEHTRTHAARGRVKIKRTVRRGH